MNPPRQVRYASVDALRGVTVAAMLLVNNPGDWGHVYAPLLHAPWHGATPTDLVFPFFLFIVGVSIALGIVPRVQAGAAGGPLRRAILVRAGRIFALGLALHALAWWALDLEWFRLWGVLQRIGLCFAAAGLLATVGGARLQWWLIALLLCGYWGLLVAGGSLEPWLNLPSRVDVALLGPRLYQFDPRSGHGHDPEGLLSTLGALATTLLGLRAGDGLRRGRHGALLVAGLIALGLACAWMRWLPLNKNLWTPSYVLWSAGWATLALLLCHVLVDRWRWPAWGRAFGVNAIAAYAGSAAMVYVLAASGGWAAIYQQGFASWMTPRVGPYLPSLAFAVCFVAFWWGVVRWMDRRRWYLKV